MDSGKDTPMNYKLIGALCVILGCGSCGFVLTAQYLARIRLLQNLMKALVNMECELQYRCTPLPQLCRQAGKGNQGKIQQILILLADEMDAQVSPNVEMCMYAALAQSGLSDSVVCAILTELGKHLGNFDMTGQVHGLQYVRKLCSENLEQLQHCKESRLRSYQTLGLCAGAAMAILLV